MKRVVINDDGDRLGTLNDDPFEVTSAPGVDEDLEAEFDGVTDSVILRSVFIKFLKWVCLESNHITDPGVPRRPRLEVIGR